MTSNLRATAIITGASGGMGRACARVLGATMDLVLTDITSAPLEQFSAEMQDEGYTVLATAAGDLGDPKVLTQLSSAADTGLGLGALVHTAGLSPAQADWKTVLRVNSLVTKRLVDAIEPLLRPGTVAVLVASMAGHVNLPMPDADRLLAQAENEEELEKLRPFLFGTEATGKEAEAIASGMAYVLSKREVIRLCEKEAVRWGAHGARIVSVSPGLIFTPMGRREAEGNPQTKMLLEFQPVKRWGTTSDIAAAVQFLLSPAASFITGCDLRIDGGATALAQQTSN